MSLCGASLDLHLIVSPHPQIKDPSVPTVDEWGWGMCWSTEAQDPQALSMQQCFGIGASHSLTWRAVRWAGLSLLHG